MKKFSIIIPIYNAEFLSFQLQTIQSLQYPREKFQVVYVDDGSDQVYVEKYRKLFGAFSEINIHYDYFGDKQGRFRVQECRNRGVNASMYEDIIFIDADCLFPEYYLKNLNLILQKNDFPVILGWSVGYNHLENTPSIIPQDIVDKKYEKYLSDSRFSDFRVLGNPEKWWHVFIGGNFYVKKNILLEVGGWDNTIASWGGGDIDVGYRLYKAGYEIEFLSGIEVYNIKDESRVNARKILSFMKNQCYLIEKYHWDREYFDYVVFRYNWTPVKYKIGNIDRKFQSIFFPKKKILLYCSSSYGMGHFMRTLKIYTSLSRKFDVKMIIEGQIAESFLQGVNYTYIQNGSFTGDDTESLRFEYFRDFLPDYFLVDFFPFGKFSSKTDIDFLIDMTQENKGKVFSYMRDIYDGVKLDSETLMQKELRGMLGKQDFYTSLVHAYEKKQIKFLGKILIEKYIQQGKIDALLVFGDKKYFDISEDEYKFSADISDKIHYLGYLLSGKKKQHSTDINFPKKILVSSGGSFFNKKHYLKLLKILGNIPNIEVDFFPGNKLLDSEVESLRRFLSFYSNIHLHDFSQQYYELLQKAHIVFFCGGYNSFCDMLQYHKKAYVLNYEKENPKYLVDVLETQTRLQALESLGLFCDISQFDREKILRIIMKNEPQVGVFDINTGGYNGVLDFISSQENTRETI